jgi:hypothetical protein
MCYLLQLVQALRYEIASPPHLTEFLVQRAVNSPELCYFLFWYFFLPYLVEFRSLDALITRVNRFLSVECQDEKYKDYYTEKKTLFENTLAVLSLSLFLSLSLSMCLRLRGLLLSHYVQRNCPERLVMLRRMRSCVQRLEQVAKEIKQCRSKKVFVFLHLYLHRYL